MQLQEMAPDLRRRVDIARETRLAREAEMRKQVDAQVSFLYIPIFAISPVARRYF